VARVECDESTTAGYFELLSSFVDRVPANAVDKSHEAWSDDCVNITKTRIIFPATFPDFTIFIPIPISVFRMNTRSTTIACIAGEGRALKPILILPPKTADFELFEAGKTASGSIYLTFSDRRNDGGVVVKLLSRNEKMERRVQEILLKIVSPLNNLGMCRYEGKMIESETFRKRRDVTRNDLTKCIDHAPISWSENRKMKLEKVPNESNETEK
jgi:hypothetical protein